MERDHYSCPYCNWDIAARVTCMGRVVLVSVYPLSPSLSSARPWTFPIRRPSSFCGLVAGISLSFLRSWLENNKIPAMAGSSGPISSYLAALRFIQNANEMVSIEYFKNRTGVFRMPTLFRWEYVVSGPQHVREIAGVPEHILSFQEAAADNLEIDWTMGPEVAINQYHAEAVRGGLTRNLSRCFPEVHDEIVHAFDDVLALEGTEWKLINVVPALMQVVARTSNRLFVGLPLCRDPEYLQLNIDYAIAIFTRGQLIRLIPGILKPIFAPLFSSRKSSLRRALKVVGTTLEQRLQQEEEYGRDRPDRPNDMISWLLDIAPEGKERTAPGLALRLLVVNMAAIHTSSMGLTAALYDLVQYPTHIAPMREEAERVIGQQGWTKAALGNLHKIDSFIRESQRINFGAIAMNRKVVSPEGFTFADGTTIPQGAYLNVSAGAHLDPENYENPKVFDGFRFSRQREGVHDTTKGDGEKTGIFNRQMVSTAPTHVVFGHGRHACPGRFFAATELKAMLAHVLINYDIKAETEGVRPKDVVFGAFRNPSSTGKIWIRKREHEAGKVDV